MTGEVSGQHPTTSAAGEDGFEIGADAADQATAADGHEDGIERWKLAVQLDGDGSLPRHDVQVVIGRDEDLAGCLPAAWRAASSAVRGSSPARRMRAPWA